MTVVGVAAPDVPGHRRGRGSLALDSGGDVGASHSRLRALLDRRTRWMQILGRLRPDVTLEHAQAGLQPWFKAMLDEDTRRVGFPIITPERRQQFLASTLGLTPAHRAIRACGARFRSHSGSCSQLRQSCWVWPA